MKICRANESQLKALLDDFNRMYMYPNPMTHTDTYSNIQVEYGTNQFAMIIFDNDEYFVNTNYPDIIVSDEPIASDPSLLPTFE